MMSHQIVILCFINREREFGRKSEDTRLIHLNLWIKPVYHLRLFSQLLIYKEKFLLFVKVNGGIFDSKECFILWYRKRICEIRIWFKYRSHILLLKIKFCEQLCQFGEQHDKPSRGTSSSWRAWCSSSKRSYCCQATTK